MPIYEYKAATEASCDYCRDGFETLHGMKELLTACPECGGELIKLVSLCNGFAKKQANQYPEVLKAKYWRDQNGIRHRVTSSDGHAKSPTVSRQKTVPPEVAEARRQTDRKNDLAKQRKRQMGL